MPTTTDLINEFYQFDEDKLKKLLTIGRSILSPMDTELTSVDFSSMVEEVFKPNGLADQYFPEWTDRSSSDFGRFLVELFAIFSDKDFFYINHFSREGFLGTAELYRSIFHKAQHLGYNPPSNKAATGNVQLIFSSGVDEFVPRGSVILGISGMPSMVYTNKETIIPASSIDQAVNVEFMHGKVQRQQQLFDGYSIVLDVPNIVDESIVLTIDGEQWQQTTTFLNGNTNTQHFMVFFDEDGRAEIMFARGGLGLVPGENSVCDIEYVVGGGYIGDISENTLDRVVTSQTTRNLLSFTQFEMTGGSDITPMEELRQIVMGKHRHQDRIVTPEDAEYFAKELSFVEKVSSDAVLNFTYVYVLPKSGGELTISQKNLVKAHLEPHLMMGQNLTISSAIFVPVTMVVNIYLLPTTPKAGAMLVATQTINEFLDPLKLGDFGVGVNRSILSSKLLQRVNGSQNVVFEELHRSGQPLPVADLLFGEQEVVDMVNSSIVVNIYGGI